MLRFSKLVKQEENRHLDELESVSYTHLDVYKRPITIMLL